MMRRVSDVSKEFYLGGLKFEVLGEEGEMEMVL